MEHPVYTILNEWVSGDDIFYAFNGLQRQELERLIQFEEIQAYQFVKHGVNGEAYCIETLNTTPIYTLLFSRSALDVIKNKHPEAIFVTDLYNKEPTIRNFFNIYLDYLKNHRSSQYQYYPAIKLFKCIISHIGGDASPNDVNNDVLVAIQTCLLSNNTSLRSSYIKNVLGDAWDKGCFFIKSIETMFSVDDAVKSLPKSSRYKHNNKKSSTTTGLREKNDMLKENIEAKTARTAHATIAKAEKTAGKWAIQLERAVSLALDCAKQRKACSFADHEKMWINRFGESPVREALRAMRRALDDDMVEGPR